MHIYVHMLIFNAWQFGCAHTPNNRHISTRAEILSSLCGLIWVDVWIKPVMAVGNWNRIPFISVLRYIEQCVGVAETREAERLRSLGTITLICGSIMLLMRTNCTQFETWISGEMFEFRQIDLFRWMRDNNKIYCRHVRGKCFTWGMKVTDGGEATTTCTTRVLCLQQRVTL